MAVYRTIQMSFWTDAKITDTFSTDEKLMYLYLLTNPHTNLCGCYEVSNKQIAFEIGFRRDLVEKLIKSLREKRVIDYSTDTNEILLVNWHKYNWTKSEKFRKPLQEDIKKVKYIPFRRYIERNLYGTDIEIDDTDTVSIPYQYGTDTVSIPYPYRMDTTDSVSVSVSDSVSDSDMLCSSNDMVCVNKNQSAERTTKKSRLEEAFDELWKIYPRKQGKQKAFEAYKSAIKDGVTDEEIKTGIESYRNYIRASSIEPQFIKQGCTFFSQRAWSDDWTPIKKKDQYTQRLEDMENWGKQYES